MYIGEQINSAKDQAKADIAWLVKIRNSITHSTGTTESKIPNRIFYRLKIAVFCSVFERAGYEFEEIKQIITDYTNG